MLSNHQIIQNLLSAAALCDTSMQRLELLSASFLGCPYELGALGEGEEGRFDQRPLYRFDAFDCVTYVNTVLALFYAHDGASFLHTLIRLNYRNQSIAYENRYHFFRADWNVANQNNGYVEDCTLKIKDAMGQSLAQTVHKMIDRPGWLLKRTVSDLFLTDSLSGQVKEQRLKELHAMAHTLKIEAVSLDYLPIVTLLADGEHIAPTLAVQFPELAIIEIVRPDWDIKALIGTDLLVSHVGFLLKRANGELRFRHASRDHGVVDVSLQDYLCAFRDHATVKGIHVERILG